MSERFYITTTLPYVNAAPHIGFALEIIQADVLARFHKLSGEEVFFNTGTDEHGLKIYRAAAEAGKSPQDYVDEYAEKFKRLKTDLNLWEEINFIRTTDPHHLKAAQEFWKRCAAKGDIYKGIYKSKYCVGCELEKTDSELVEGHCSIHPNLELEIIEEENYFFRFSKYAEPLLELYEKNPDFVAPKERLNEIKNLLKSGLKDFSVSRLAEKMPWGIPVPNDEKHVMYVWFDALVNYISALGWPDNPEKFSEFWGTKEKPNAVQIAGKDNLRQQAAMWQAMLMSADLPNSKKIIIHGFITSGGQKMSKSLGNVINPLDVIEKYGADALRYWLLREISPFEDGDFTWEKFNERYNADLANGLGNFASRVMKMASDNNINYNKTKFIVDADGLAIGDGYIKRYRDSIDECNFQSALKAIWDSIKWNGDHIIQKNEPFKKIKTNPEEAKKDINFLLFDLDQVAIMLKPFMPATSEKILEAIRENSEIKTPLFPRK